VTQPKPLTIFYRT